MGWGGGGSGPIGGASADGSVPWCWCSLAPWPMVAEKERESALQDREQSGVEERRGDAIGGRGGEEKEVIVGVGAVREQRQWNRGVGARGRVSERVRGTSL